MRRALLAVVLVAAGVAWLGSVTPVRTPGPGSVALGPEQGQPVADYLAAADAELAELPGTDSAPRWALVTLTDGVRAAQLSSVLDGLRVSRVLFHVQVPRVQTAVVAIDTAGQGPAEGFLTAAQASAAAAEAAGAQNPGRAGAVAAFSAEQLRSGCGCVVGLLVRGDPAALQALRERPGVRSVQPANAGASYGGLAVRPLLPEQTGVVGPGPDDGRVPP